MKLRTTPFRKLNQRLVATSYRSVMRGYERYMGSRRFDLLSQVRGDVVEIGPGTGTNLMYYDDIKSWLGIEPNRFMWKQLERELESSTIEESKIVDGTAERIPCEDGSVDSVVSTLVLCSVPSQETVLNEIHRVLRPGGCFYFLEHVIERDARWRRCCQRLAWLPWKLVADQCCTNRDTLEEIESSLFARVDAKYWHVPFPTTLPFLSPHIIGIATK